MYDQYLRAPASVSDDGRQLFDNGRLAELPVIPTDRAEVLGRGERGEVPSAAPPRTSPLSPLPGALTPITGPAGRLVQNMTDSLSVPTDRKSTRLNSSHGYISYAVFCLKKKNNLSQSYLRATPRLGRNAAKFVRCVCAHRRV